MEFTALDRATIAKNHTHADIIRRAIEEEKVAKLSVDVSKVG